MKVSDCLEGRALLGIEPECRRTTTDRNWPFKSAEKWTALAMGRRFHANARRILGPADIVFSWIPFPVASVGDPE